jgi:hypothetical protein
MIVKIKGNMLNFIIVAIDALIATPIDAQNIHGFSNSLSVLGDFIFVIP